MEITSEYHGDIKTRKPAEMTTAELKRTISELEKSMKECAKNLEFERAAELRDVLFELRSSKRSR